MKSTSFVFNQPITFNLRHVKHKLEWIRVAQLTNESSRTIAGRQLYYI